MSYEIADYERLETGVAEANEGGPLLSIVSRSNFTQVLLDISKLTQPAARPTMPVMITAAAA